MVQKVHHEHIFDVSKQTTTYNNENDNQHLTIEGEYQEKDSTNIILLVNQNFNVQQYQRDDGDSSNINIENVVDHGKRS